MLRRRRRAAGRGCWSRAELKGQGAHLLLAALLLSILLLLLVLVLLVLMMMMMLVVLLQVGQHHRQGREFC